MSPADLAAWTRAARACERARPGSGKEVFWRAVSLCAAETRRGVLSDEEDTEDDFSPFDEDAIGHEEKTRHDSRALCALEASWELIFVAARAWRSAETDDSDVQTAGLGGATTFTTLARSKGVETFSSWAEPAWRAVSDLLEASPLEENEKIADAAAARVAALAKAWPRCSAAAAPAWEIWRRVGRLGKPPAGNGKAGKATTREGGANAEGPGPRGEYPAEAFAAAAAAAAAAEARFAFVGETSAAGPTAAPAAAAFLSSAAASRRARFFSVACSCCAIPPPSSARPASGASPAALVPAATSACASALDALAAHVGAASDARDVRRDLGKVLSAAAFVFASRDDEKTTQTTTLEDETVTPSGKQRGTLSSSQTSFRAFGGASAACTARSAAVRHRAATHARLMGVCLEHGMPDQAGACLRQMRAALAPGRLPSAARDPAPLAAACRAVRVAAEAWLACARRRGKETFKSDKGADVLAKEGEAAIDALFAAAAEAGARETRVGDDSRETSESRGSSPSTFIELPVPGTDLARRAGIVVAEAAAAAATTYAALVASGARPEGAAEAQTRFCAFLAPKPSAREPRAAKIFSTPSSSQTRNSWPSRVFALRALAALLVPDTWVSLETSACSSAESLVPALAAWAASAASDAAAGGVGPRRALRAPAAFPAQRGRRRRRRRRRRGGRQAADFGENARRGYRSRSR